MAGGQLVTVNVRTSYIMFLRYCFDGPKVQTHSFDPMIYEIGRRRLNSFGRHVSCGGVCVSVCMDGVSDCECKCM